MTCRIVNEKTNNLLDAFGVTKERMDYLEQQANEYTNANQERMLADLLSAVSALCESPEELMLSMLMIASNRK